MPYANNKGADQRLWPIPVPKPPKTCFSMTWLKCIFQSVLIYVADLNVVVLKYICIHANLEMHVCT